MAASQTKKKTSARDGETAATADILAAAARIHEAGDIEAAERGYRAVLALAPDNSDALQLLGVARFQQGESAEALELLDKAKALAPRSPGVHANFGSVLNALERHAEATDAFRAALSLDPSDAETWCNLGIALRAQNQMLEAAEAFERAIAFAPNTPKPRHELANLWLSLKDYPRCEDAYRGYVALVPNDPASLSNLAYAVQCQGRLDEAEELFGRAIDCAGGASELRFNLRKLMAQQGRSGEAKEKFRALLKENPSLWTAELGVAIGLIVRGAARDGMELIDDVLNTFPDRAEIWNDVGQILVPNGRVAEALEILKRACDIDPNLADAHNNLGVAYNQSHRATDAVPHFQEALRLRPDFLSAHLNIAQCHQRLGDLDRANMYACAAMELPDFRPANFAHIAHILRRVCDFDALDRLGDVWENCNLLPAHLLPATFLDLLVYARTREDVMAFVGLVRRWAELIETQAAAGPLPSPVARSRNPAEPLRVGFLSSDMRSHSVAKFLLPLLRDYDRRRFAFYCYAPVNVYDDPIQVEIRKTVDKFTFVENRTAYDVAKTIRSDDVDILFELNGFTDGTRLDALAWRPAPVQISWLGYPFTCGLKAIDHVVVDRFVKPADPAFLTEEPIEMPEAWVCFGEFADVAVNPVLPMERNGVVTFGTLNNPYKYTREMVALWSRVLAAVPGSRLLVVRPETRALALIRNLCHAFEQHGISSDRLLFADNKTANRSHLDYYNEIDISLDTFPLTGGTTTCDATWMGVPVVSLVGESFHQRISYSVLMQCGLEELCVFNPDDFVSRAVALAGDAPKLRALRGRLRDVMRASPLCDQPRFVHQFQEMLEQVARHHGLR